MCNLLYIRPNIHSIKKSGFKDIKGGITELYRPGFSKT